jgi:hypothetical protein
VARVLSAALIMLRWYAVSRRQRSSSHLLAFIAPCHRFIAAHYGTQVLVGPFHENVTLVFASNVHANQCGKLPG